MQPVNQELFREWRSHPVTEALMASLKERIEEGKLQIVNSNDPEYDRIVKGMVRAYQDVLEVALEEKQDMIELIEEAE